MRRVIRKFFTDAQPIGGRHVDIKDKQVWCTLVDELQDFQPVRSGSNADPELLAAELQCLQEPKIAICDKNGLVCHDGIIPWFRLLLPAFPRHNHGRVVVGPRNGYTAVDVPRAAARPEGRILRSLTHVYDSKVNDLLNARTVRYGRLLFQGTESPPV